jgi:hypothetical protein
LRKNGRTPGDIITLLCTANSHLINPSEIKFSMSHFKLLSEKRDLDLVASRDLPAVDDLVDVVVSLLVVELLQIEHASYVVL